jgi:hypothetical protein
MVVWSLEVHIQTTAGQGSSQSSAYVFFEQRAPSSRPTCFTSTARPLQVNLELRAMTNSEG